MAVTVACLGEAVSARVRPALPLLLLACGALAPDARAYLPLAAYDLARPWLPDGCDARGWPRALPAAAGALLACACAAGDAATAPLRLLCCGVACLLSARATQAERRPRPTARPGTICGAARWSLPPRTATSWTARSTRSSLPPLPSGRALPGRSTTTCHLLTRATLQVEALRVVHAGEPRVQADFADVGATLGEALDTVRASVHALREDSIDLGVQLRKVVADVMAAAPLAVELDVRCDRVPPNACSCLLAVTREALSNVRDTPGPSAWC